MSAAPHGSLILVLDVNFLQASSDASFQLFIDNLIAYLNLQAILGSSGFYVPISDNITLGAATTLDSLILSSQGTTAMNTALSGINLLPNSQRAAILHRLTPLANNAQAQVVIHAVDTGLTNVVRHLDGIRNDGAAASAKPGLSSLSASTPDTQDLHLDVWGKVFGGYTNQNSMGGYAGYTADTWGLTVGADRRLAPSTVLGAAFTFSSTDIDQQEFLVGSGGNVKNYQLTVYATHDFGGFFIDAEVSHSLQRSSEHRDTEVNGIAAGKFLRLMRIDSRFLSPASFMAMSGPDGFPPECRSRSVRASMSPPSPRWKSRTCPSRATPKPTPLARSA